MESDYFCLDPVLNRKYFFLTWPIPIDVALGTLLMNEWRTLHSKHVYGFLNEQREVRQNVKRYDRWVFSKNVQICNNRHSSMFSNIWRFILFLSILYYKCVSEINLLWRYSDNRKDYLKISLSQLNIILFCSLVTCVLVFFNILILVME